MNKIFTLFFLFLSLSFFAHRQQNTTESQQIQQSNAVDNNLISNQNINLLKFNSNQISTIKSHLNLNY